MEVGAIEVDLAAASLFVSIKGWVKEVQGCHVGCGTIDQFEDVPFAAFGPAGALPHVESKGPVRRPDALLLPARVAPEAYLGLEYHEVARVAGEAIPAFEAGRGPVACRTVFTRDDVELAVARHLRVCGGVGISLKLVVRSRANFDVPCVGVCSSASRAVEVIPPDESEAWHFWHHDG